MPPHTAQAGHGAAAAAPEGHPMDHDVVAFSAFTLACAAGLAGLMLEYSRRVHRLRPTVAAMSRVVERVEQQAKGE